MRIEGKYVIPLLERERIRAKGFFNRERNQALQCTDHPSRVLILLIERRLLRS